jgi:hypothetical protein
VARKILKQIETDFSSVIDSMGGNTLIRRYGGIKKFLSVHVPALNSSKTFKVAHYKSQNLLYPSVVILSLVTRLYTEWYSQFFLKELSCTIIIRMPTLSLVTLPSQCSLMYL